MRVRACVSASECCVVVSVAIVYPPLRSRCGGLVSLPFGNAHLHLHGCAFATAAQSHRQTERDTHTHAHAQTSFSSCAPRPVSTMWAYVCSVALRSHVLTNPE